MRRVLIPVLIMFLMVASLPGTCLADTASASSSLTVEQAIDLALKNRTDVLQAELNLNAAAISSDLAWGTAAEQLAASHIPGTTSYESEGTDSLTGTYSADYNLKAAQKNYDTKLEAVKFSVYSKYYAVVNALDKADAQRLASQQADEKLKTTTLRCQLGMDTKLTLYLAQSAATSAKGTLATTEKDLDQQYIALMEYIGMSNTSRPSLARELKYEPINIADPEQKFKDVVNNSPSVWLAKQSVLLTEQTAGNSTSAELDDINLEKADINVLTTRDSMIQATRNIYYSIKSLEESYATAQAAVLSTQEALRVSKLMLELGMGTKLDVLNAEIAANSASQTLDNLTYQHAILVMALEKPWAYGSSS